MIRCIAVDDEPLALSQIAGYISRVPFLELVAVCQDAFKAMKVLSEKEVDLIFLDINMPDLNGLDFVRSLIVRPLIVFTTAYSAYAVDGFKLDAVDYLLKPFDFYDLLKAADKARKHMEFKAVAGSDAGSQLNSGGSLFIKADHKVIRVNIPDIKYIESVGDHICVFVEGEEKPVMTLLSMKKIEEKLPAGQFMRVHRSYVVNLRKITEISRLRIIFENSVYIPVEEAYKEHFLDYINRMSVGK